KGEIRVSSVFFSKIFEREGKRIGYVVFNQFIAPSLDELKAVAERFSAQAVDDMILDLRYNGGGRVDVAVFLASMLLGAEVKDKRFLLSRHHKDFASWNQDISFQEDVPHRLDLKRLTVITSGATASASEVLINGLRSYIPVTVVGKSTHGKPVGMYIYAFFSKILAPVSFQLVNDNGQGDFFDGIPADRVSFDDVRYRFGDVRESAFKEAMRVVLDKPMAQALRVQRRANQRLPQQGVHPWIGAW
ncbi:MAG: S41 family peptidase, partial [Myxococcota bacterium]